MTTEIVIVGCFVSALFGLLFGSFAGATVWRLRARQLVEEDKVFKELTATAKKGDELSADEKEYRQMLGESAGDRKKELQRLHPIIKSVRNDRSQCLHCHHELAWYDLLPLLSWVSTRGKCRYCKRAIGTFEPAIEIGTALVFAAVFAYWAQSQTEWWLLIGALVAAVMLIILFAYDLKWFILPDVVMWPLIGLSSILAVYQVIQQPDHIQALISLAGSIFVLAGLYLVLWLYSKGQWVGFGDVKLGLALGLLLANWQLAFLTLFLANLLGTLIVIPGLLTGKLTRSTKVPFGPLLIAGFAIVVFTGPLLLNGLGYLSLGLADTLLML